MTKIQMARKDEIVHIDTNVTRIEDNLLNIAQKVDSNHDVVTAQLAQNAVNVKSYGATGLNLADDTAFIKAAYDTVPIGGTFLLPDGLYRTTEPIVFSKNINVDMRGTIVAHHDGIAIDVVGMGIGNTYIPKLRLKAIKSIVNHAQPSVGIRIKNGYGMQIRMDYSGGFTTGLQLIGAESKGCVYNEISLGQIYNTKTQIHITSDGTGGAWANQNTFISGRLYYPNTGLREGYTQIKIDGDTNDTPLYRNNGNTFIGTSLEDIGLNGQYAKAVVCNGHSNQFLNVRTEGSMQWDFGTASFRNFVNGGCYIYMHNMNDLGSFNDFETQGTGSKRTVQTGSNKFVAGANGTTGIEAYGHGQSRIPARFYNTSSNGYPAIQLMETDGVTVAGELNANGLWTVRGGTRKVSFGVFIAAPTTGEWKRGDISFVTNPSANGVIGYICVADGTPGSWQPFGLIGQTQMTSQSASTATDVTSLVSDFNVLLTKLKTAKLMA